jgi:hypothetical protein
VRLHGAGKLVIAKGAISFSDNHVGSIPPSIEVRIFVDGFDQWEHQSWSQVQIPPDQPARAEGMDDWVRLLGGMLIVVHLILSEGARLLVSPESGAESQSIECRDRRFAVL